MTSSPKTVMPSKRTQQPTQHLQPIMQFSNQECDLMTVSRRIVQRLMQTPKMKLNLVLCLLKKKNCQNTIFNYDTRAYGNIRSNLAPSSNFRRWID